jgi:hypothetical protein
MSMQSLIVTSLILACSSFSFAGVADNVKCLDGIGASQGDAPELVQDISPTSAVIICGDSIEKVPKSTSYKMSEFDIYFAKNIGQASASVERVLTVGAADITTLSALPNGVRLTSQLFVHGKVVPTFSMDIVCGSDICLKLAPVCAFKKMKAGSTQVLKEIGRYVDGDKKGQVPSSKIVADLGALALSGNAQAKAYFLNPPKDLMLEGESGEYFADLRENVMGLTASGCL